MVFIKNRRSRRHTVHEALHYIWAHPCHHQIISSCILPLILTLTHIHMLFQIILLNNLRSGVLFIREGAKRCAQYNFLTRRWEIWNGYMQHWAGRLGLLSTDNMIPAFLVCINNPLTCIFIVHKNYLLAWRYEFYVLVSRTISHLFTVLTCEKIIVLATQT